MVDLKFPKALDALFRPPISLEYRDCLILTDIHCPYQQCDLLEFACTTAIDLGIETCVIGGDFFTFDALYPSRKKLEITIPVQQEILIGREILQKLINVFDVFMLPGNHDQYYMNKNGRTFDELINLDTLNTSDPIVHTTEYDFITIGNWIVGHLSQYDPPGGKLEIQIAEKLRRHVISGHQHLANAALSHNGYLGISCGGLFEQHRFWYKERSFNTLPDHELGFIILRGNVAYHYQNGTSKLPDTRSYKKVNLDGYCNA